MRITINDNNEITGYAIVGGIEGDFEIDDSIIPHDFTQNYKPKYYLYQNEQIVVNRVKSFVWSHKVLQVRLEFRKSAPHALTSLDPSIHRTHPRQAVSYAYIAGRQSG